MRSRSVRGADSATWQMTLAARMMRSRSMRWFLFFALTAYFISQVYGGMTVQRVRLVTMVSVPVEISTRHQMWFTR